LLSAEQTTRHSGRLAVRPGLTGWAQVHGGRAVSADDKAAMDLWYIRNASFRLDFEIALKTLHMVFFGERANERVIALAWKDCRELAIPTGVALR
jgi:lipopolysaccharide/colanic/teichoic acid biosynthesis glycosyltransferase